MRLVIQRVKEASCTVNGAITGQIAQGFMVLVGMGIGDDRETVKKMATKLSKLRIFEDDNNKMNLDIYAVGGSILSISQFTLYADAAKGNRPSFTDAMKGPEANELYEFFNSCLEELGLKVEKGVFGADMAIKLWNDGPVTVILDSKELFK